MLATVARAKELTGNDNRDACSFSPAGAERAVTVGASTLSDERAYFSNFGKCVDIFAPGLNILSTYKGSKDAVATLSGTSMASPHTAGLLAYLLSLYPSEEFNPTFDSAENLVSLHSERILSASGSASPSSLYAMAHQALPPFISSYLPSPELLHIVLENTNAAPIPNKISPDQMKKALIKLGTLGVLTDVSEDSPNVLIYNNATA
jgi:cerevisin